ncbi:MAG: hypothetical protein JHC61_02170 [Burkholderiaceae bacterium]|nr:hypothetical protein [Burkholderiaceae bacterium]
MTRPKHSDRDRPDHARPGHTEQVLVGKIIPPSSLVDVPNRPAPVPQSARQPPARPRVTTATRLVPHTPEDQGGYAHADARQDVDPTRSSWADSTQPAPNKKNARSSLL